MAKLWQHHIEYAIFLGYNFADYINLECVDGLRKNDNGGFTIYLKNVVHHQLFTDGLMLCQAGENWIGRDEEGRWWLFSDEEYKSLGPEGNVTLLPNKKTQHQVMLIQALEKMKREFAAMSPEEQMALHNKYPEMFIVEKE